MRQTFRCLMIALALLLPTLAIAIDTTEGKCYLIHNARSTNAYMQDNLRADNVVDAFAANAYSYWRFIPTGNKDCYYLQNVTTKRYMQQHGTQAQVEVKMGDTPAEYYVAPQASEGGAYGFCSTNNTKHSFEAGCVALNLKGEPHEAVSSVQTYAAQAGTNHRSFWLLEERDESKIDIPIIIPDEDLSNVPEDSLYRNPLIETSLPDPTVMLAPDGFYYLYATENVRNMPIYRSQNLVDWDFLGTCFTEKTRPTFVKTDRASCLWAPDINYFDGHYVMYYSMSDWGGEWTCGVGVAIADQPEGPFTDLGPLFISSEMNTQNSIDPFFIEEDGHKYLFWGSFRGIWYTELTEDGLHLKDGMKYTKIAGTLTEGTYIIKRDGYYYMIGSAGTCCDGLNSTYRLVVARSEKLLGPYVDKAGMSVMDNNWSPLLNKSAEVYGPGHCSEIIEDAAGQTWVFYHGWDAATGGGRYLYMDQVLWDDNGWPYIRNRKPSTVARRPIMSLNNGTTAITETPATSGIEVYRVHNSFRIQMKDDTEFRWQLVNTHGQVMDSGQACGNAEVSTQALPWGMYIIKVEAGNEVITSKIIRH